MAPISLDEPTGRYLCFAEQDAAARVLAGAADRDVEEIRGELRDFRRATIGSLNAMREDIVGLADDLVGVDGKVAGLQATVGGLAEEMRAKFEHAAGQQQIVGLLETLIDRGSTP